MEIHIELQVQAAKNILPMPWSWRYKFTVYNCITKKHLVKKSLLIKALGMKTTEVLW